MTSGSSSDPISRSSSVTPPVTPSVMPSNSATDLLPVLVHQDRQQAIAYRGGQAISVAQFLADAYALAALLPDARYLLNGCIDRYHCVVTMTAALLRRQTNVLPHNHVPATLGHVQTQFKGLYCVTDSETLFVDLVRVNYPKQMAAPGDHPIPMIAADLAAACLFTSGSTGDPVAHPRTWGQMVLSARSAVQRLHKTVSGGYTILGTVPPQHSYGFESTVHLALQGGGALVADRPFFPADIVATLAALPRPVALVTTPVHLRALLTVAPPAIDLILSATAPLPLELAYEVEQRFGAPVLEIYGSTESGQVASRRTTAGELWQALDGVQMSVVPLEQTHEDPAHAGSGLAVAQGPFVNGTIVMSDLISMRDAGRFVLHGRIADMVNIAGKRSSLAFLERQLLSIDGVVDGAFLINEEASRATARVIAFVVAPTLSAQAITDALRERIETVFLPRPLLLVDGLPRDGNGKLPRQRLEALARSLLRVRAKPANLANPANPAKS